ncbi:MAG: PQQ-binding-like beta-propeller repeat protein [Leptolyngbya sp. Prado105]|nr:PQQ-binding-like beta-propeller repeat protein [Leptolyngbya sp. Prado105]
MGQQRSATLLALDSNTGKIRWLQPLRTGRDFYSRGAIAANGTVILGVAESSTTEREQRLDTYRIRAFDVQSGEPLWTTNPLVDETKDGIGYWFASNDAIDVQPNVVYVQMGDELRSLDPRTGQQRWAMKRPWLNPNDRALRFGLGIVATEESLAVLQLGRNQRVLQTINPKTGTVIRQITLPFKPLESTSNRITVGNRLAFLETSGQIPAGDNAFLPSGQSTLTAYNLETGQIQFRIPIAGEINNLRAVDQTLQLSTDPVIDFKSNPSKPRSEGQFMGLDLQTGRVLWQKSEAQIRCYGSYRAWRVSAESVYLNCNRRQDIRDSSTIVSLSARTGQIQWETLVSPDNHSDTAPSAIASRQFLTFRRVSGANESQLQAIALDRQTGKLLWSKAFFNSQDLPYMDSFRATIATDQNKVFVLDAVPQWQLWLLSLNRDWYLNQAIEAKVLST